MNTENLREFKLVVVVVITSLLIIFATDTVVVTVLVFVVWLSASAVADVWRSTKRRRAAALERLKNEG